VLLIRDGLPAGEWDRIEVLVHELGHYLGAVRVADPNSVMRPGVGDGKAGQRDFTIRFDPVNVLLLNMWAEQLRTGKVKSWKDLTPVAKARFARVYDGMMAVTPEEKFAQPYHDLILAVKNNPGAVAVAPTPMATPSVPMPVTPNTPMVPTLPKPMEVIPPPGEKMGVKEKAIRNVVTAVGIAAGEAAKAGLKEDAFTEALAKAAAAAALKEDETVRAAAFSVGLGLGLDDSTVLRNNPLTRTLCLTVDPEATFQARAKLLSAATIHNRRDLCQHFAVSLALAELVGPKLAEQTGVAKELADAKGTSGFSFADLQADFAGVELFNRVKSDENMLKRLSVSFTITATVPSLEGLKEGLSTKDFESQYGGVSDTRYKTEVAKIRDRIKTTQDALKK
jgi:hypothetical protein